MGNIRVYRNNFFREAVESADPIHQTLIPFLNDIIEHDWNMVFREWFTVDNLVSMDVWIDAPCITGTQFREIQEILKERMSRDFQIIGRDIEYSGIEYIYHMHHSFVHSNFPEMNIIPKSMMDSLPIEVIYAGVYE